MVGHLSGLARKNRNNVQECSYRPGKFVPRSNSVLRNGRKRTQRAQKVEGSGWLGTLGHHFATKAHLLISAASSPNREIPSPTSPYPPQPLSPSLLLRCFAFHLNLPPQKQNRLPHGADRRFQAGSRGAVKMR